MADPLFTAIALKALDSLTARSAVTAENIANSGTPHYRPLRLNFEQALASAATRGVGAVEALQPTIAQDPGELRLDLEMATASATQARYSALIQVLDRQMQLDDLMISGIR